MCILWLFFLFGTNSYKEEDRIATKGTENTEIKTDKDVQALCVIRSGRYLFTCTRTFATVIL